MKFPRNAKIIRSHFDAAPFAAVFFCLLIFLLIAGLLPTPGLPLHPPSADDLPGLNQPSVAMAVDAGGRFYFENQIVTEAQLKNSLFAAARAAREPLQLVIHADRLATYETLAHLAILAREAGITNSLLATLPRVEDPSETP